MITCLGIESTCHTFGVGIIKEDGKILADEKSIYKPPLGKGIIPRETSKHHCQNAKKVLMSALTKAKLQLNDIDIIAVAIGAGMSPCLSIGASVARYISLIYRKPFVGVCHQIGHIEIGKLTTGSKDPIVLYLSGGNSQIIAFAGGRYRVLGETEDIPIGNALDCLARELGLPMPGGPEIEKLAKGGGWVDLPYVVKGMDVSFSGLLTEAIRKFKGGAKREDICYSFQENCFAMLTEATERALAHTDKKEVLITGGVAANKRLKGMVDVMCKERNAKFYSVPFEYSGDNGLMIAWNGILAYKSGQEIKIQNSVIKPKWRTDEVDIAWL